MFGEYVGWAALTINLAQVDTFRSHRLLYPQGVSVQMPELAKPLPRAYANCSAGISPHAQRQLDTHILKQSLVTEALARSSDYSANSASPELRDMLDCVEDQCFMQWRPRIAHPPDVDLRVSGHPAQSVSVYTSTASASCCSYTYTSRGAPAK